MKLLYFVGLVNFKTRFSSLLTLALFLTFTSKCHLLRGLKFKSPKCSIKAG